MKEIVKTNGGKEFFNELDAASIPFFFAAAVENTKETTEYFCRSMVPNAMGISLTDDKFADWLDIRNHGFVAVPSFDLTSQSIQGLRQMEETRKRESFYSNEMLEAFAEKQGILIEDGGIIDGEEETPTTVGRGMPREFVGSVIQHAVDDKVMPGYEDTKRIPVLEHYCESIDIVWGGNEHQDQVYEEEYAKIDERHKEILKGDGSFLQAKERELVYCNLRDPRQPEMDSDGATESENTEG